MEDKKSPEEGGGSDEKVSTKKCNVQGDDDIFALGDAASELGELGDLDDLFSGMGVGLNDLIHGGTGQVVAGQPGNGDATTKVYSFSKTDSNGKVTKGRVVQGPVKCVKRIVKISRETPNGPEVIAEIETEPDTDISKLVNNFKQRAKRNTGSYDNFDLEKGDTNEAELKTQVVAVTAGEDGEEQYIEESSVDDHHKPHLKQGFRYPEQEPLLEDVGSGAEGTPRIPQHETNQVPNRNQSLVPGVDFIYDPNKPRSDSINSNHIYNRKDSILPPHQQDSYEASYEKHEEGDECTGTRRYECDICCLTIDCTPCIPCLAPTRSPQRKKWKTNHHNKKGGMTSSEVTKDSNALPGVKSLVANFAKMLFQDREHFIETMFRAVKLNKLDVVRILCKIVQKANLKLSHDSLREPESSATILHVALLYNHTDIVDFLLLLKEPDLILAKYETSQYHNQTGLHVAVANGDITVVEKLLLALQVSERQILINTVSPLYCNVHI